MSRKVFITVLGAGKYEPCIYSSSRYTSGSVRFIQQATIEYTQRELGVEWTSDDKALVFMTDGAENKHWKDGPTTEGLRSVLLSMPLPQGIVEAVKIPEGKNEQEVMQIFQTFYDKIEEGDELYFDITHGFRYLPMLVLVLVNYSKLLKNVKVKSITYGNWEGRENEIAPIVNLTELSSVQDCAIAVGSFLDSGNVGQLKRFCEDYGVDAYMQGLVQELSDMIDDWVNCRLEKFYSGRKYLDMRDRLKAAVDNEQTIPYMREMFGKIIDRLSRFEVEEDVKNPYIVSKWCIEHHYYLQALTIFKEAFVTEVCKRYGMCHTNLADRNYVENCFTKNTRDKNSKPFDYGELDKEKLDELSSRPETVKLQPYYDIVDGARDEMTHARGKYSENSINEFVDKAYSGLVVCENNGNDDKEKIAECKRRKVVLSMVGTSPYGKARYSFNGIVTDEKKTPSEGFVECMMRGIAGDDDYGIYILTTHKAKEANWDNTKISKSGVAQDGGMKARLEAVYGGKVENILLSEDSDGKGFHENFTAIMNVIKDSDDVYIDISNSLRYMQMMMMVVVEMIRTMGKADVKGIYYANYVKDQNITPIMDFTSLTTLQDWIVVANDYKANGQVLRLEKGIRLFRKKHQELRESSKEASKSLDKYSRNIVDVIDKYWHGMRGEKIYSAKDVRLCIEEADTFKNVNLIPPLNPIIDLINETFNKMDKSQKNIFHNGLVVAQWFFDKGLYLQCSNLLYKVLDKEKDKAEVNNIKDEFKETRNNFAHCGTLNNSMEPSELKGNLVKALKDAKQLEAR